MELLATLGLPDFNAAVKLGVTCREYGLRSGWFAWPYNFDPIWLLTCSGFQEKEERDERTVDRTRANQDASGQGANLAGHV